MLKEENSQLKEQVLSFSRVQDSETSYWRNEVAVLKEQMHSHSRIQQDPETEYLRHEVQTLREKLLSQKIHSKRDWKVVDN
jgi:hypothetical protein